MPNHLRELRGTFMDCSSLTSVSLPEWATNLSHAFYGIVFAMVLRIFHRISIGIGS